MGEEGAIRCAAGVEVTKSDRAFPKELRSPFRSPAIMVGLWVLRRKSSSEISIAFLGELYMA